MQLEPREYFTIVRGLENHLDSSTYYVRAVIRNAKTDVLIDTVNLADAGDGHRFYYNWQVPSDSSGAGHYISIVTSVYTDSGYTTKAENYADVYNVYLVQERMNPILAGGGGGADIDYKRVKKIVDEAVKEQLSKLPEPEKINLSFQLQPLLNAVSGLRNDVQNVPAPDFSGIQYRLDTLEKSIKAIKTPDLDVSPVLEAISGLKEDITPYTEKTTKDSEALLNRVKEFFAKDIEELKQAQQALSDDFAGRVFLAVKPTPEMKQQPEEEINYAELLR